MVISATIGVTGDTVEIAGHGGLRLEADVIGTADGLPMVLLPGAGQTRHAWRRAAERFADAGYRVWSFDLRGHGGSDWAADRDYSIDAFAGDVRSMLEAVRAPIVVGASIGGIAALIALGEHARPVARAVVLVDVVPNMSMPGLNRIRAFMAQGSVGFADLEEAAAAVAAFLPSRRTDDSAARLRRNLRPGHDGRLYWHWDPAFHAGSELRAQSGMFERMAAAARRVRLPALLVSGSRSEVVDRAAVEHLLSLMPHAEWTQVPKASHRVAGDDNDGFVASIGDFLRRRVPCV